MFADRSIRRVLSLMIFVLMIMSLFPASALSEGSPEGEPVQDAVPSDTDFSGVQDNEGPSSDPAPDPAPDPVPEGVRKETRELETVELEIPAIPTVPEYPTLWVMALDRDGRPVEGVTLELVLPTGESAGEFQTDEYGIAACDLSETADSTLVSLQRGGNDRSGYGPVSPIAAAVDGGSLVSVMDQAETGFDEEYPFVVTVYPARYTVTLYPNGGAFEEDYESFEILAAVSAATEPFTRDENEPYGYFPTDRFETYRPSKAYEGEVYADPVLEGYAISGWYTAAEGGERIVFDEDGDGTRLYTPRASVYAHWEAIDYNVVVDSAIEHGSVYPSSAIANIRDTVTLTVAPESIRYELVSLTVKQGDSELPLTEDQEAGTWSFTMPAGDVTVSAVFREITVDSAVSVVWADEENRDGIRPDSVTLTLLADGEALKSDVAVSAEGNWAYTETGLPKYSEELKEIAYLWEEQPLRGYEVQAETADGVTVLTNTLMPLYGITAETDGNGSVLAMMGETELSSAYAGDALSLTFVPAAGYELDSFSVKQGEADVEIATAEDGTVSFVMPAGEVSVSAAFRAIPYSVTVQEAEHGAVAADKSTATIGETVALTLTPEEGYEPDALSVKQGEADVEVITAEDGAVSFVMPAGEVIVSAAFRAIDYTVTVHEAENGAVTADKTVANVGDTVTLTVMPEIGYMPDSLSVKDSDDTDIEVTENAFTMPAKNVEVSASFKEAKPVFTTHSLVLGGTLGINFFMELRDFEGADYTDSYMTFQVNDETQQDSFDETDTDLNGNGYYGFTCSVNSIQMADEINAVFHYKENGEEKTVSQVYTVEAYLNALLASEEISEEVKDLARALLDYGYYSQVLLSELGGWTIDTQHVGMTTRSTEAYSADQIAGILDALADQEFLRESNRNIARVTCSLYLDSKTSIYLYLQPAENYGGEIGATLDGTPVSPVPEADGRSRIVIPDIPADQLGEIHQVVITTDGADPLTVQISALAYVKACLEDPSASDETVDAMAALYYYYTASAAVDQAS